MKTDTKDKIIELVKKRRRLRVHDLVRELDLSHVAVHKQLRKLVADKILIKIGRPPLVYYAVSSKEEVDLEIDNKYQKLINQFYLRITPQGERLDGVEGFIDWLREINKTKEADRLAKRYVEVRSKANGYIKNGLIDLTKKVKQAVGNRGVDKVYCVDFYSLPEFGKTKLGQLVFYAKQSQDKQMIDQLARETKPFIKQLIEKYKVKAVSIIPHSVPRKLQFLKEYRLRLGLVLPEVFLTKVYRGKVVVAQKSLSRLRERIENARETIMVDERRSETKARHKTVLLIDDAVGSGASMNETADKLKKMKLADKVIGFSLIGSYKGFDVIREI